MEANYKINTIPSLTWNWLKMNNDTVTLDADDFETAATPATSSSPATGTTPATDTPADCTFGSGIFNIANKKMLDSRVESESTEQAGEISVAHPLQKAFDERKSETIKITGKKADPIIINLTANGKTYTSQTIIAEKDCEATVIFVYSDDAQNNEAAQIIRTKVLAKEGSSIHIVKVQLLGSNTEQLDDTAFIA